MKEISGYIGTSLGNGKFLTIEDAKNIVGPMPVAPQQTQPRVPKPNATSA